MFRLDGAGLKPLAEWDFVRIKERPVSRPGTAEEAPKNLAKHVKVFETLLGRTWEARGEAKGNSATATAFHIQTTFESVSSLAVITARVVAPSKDGESAHLLDAYFYHHLGTNALRCLALTNQGGVYEGTWTVLDDGALQLDLTSCEGDRVVSRVVRFNFEKDGTLRHRVWPLKGAEGALMLDIHHKKLEPKKN
jgi:hypothetical protein